MNEIQDQLGHSIAEGDFEKASELLKAGAKPDGVNSIGWTPLMVAAEHENIKIIDLLISRGADVNKAGQYGQTPLHIAVDISIDGTYQTGGNPGDEPIDTMLCLLGHGADLDARDYNGKTPLDWAYDYKSQKIIKLLQEYSGLTNDAPDT